MYRSARRDFTEHVFRTFSFRQVDVEVNESNHQPELIVGWLDEVMWPRCASLKHVTCAKCVFHFNIRYVDVETRSSYTKMVRRR